MIKKPKIENTEIFKLKNCCILLFSHGELQCIRVYLRHPPVSDQFSEESGTHRWLMITYACNKF